MCYQDLSGPPHQQREQHGRGETFPLHLQRDAFADALLNTLRYDNLLSDHFMSSLYSRDPARSILFPTGGDVEIRDCILEMYLEVIRGDRYSAQLLNNMVPIFFAKLLRGHADRALTEDEHLGGKDRETRGTRLRMLSYLIDHYRTVSLTEVAEHFGYSPAHCSRLIKKETGISFSTFVQKIKLQKAEALLRDTRLSIAAISGIIGYENPESFIRAFEKVYGESPSVYRRTLPRA